MNGNESKECFKFQQVLSDELDILNILRRQEFEPKPDLPEPKTKQKARECRAFHRAHEANLTGLAFSGGGIRSATFNLGVLQALAKARKQDGRGKNGLLSRFDYLSTVSGGGYIGAWFSAWLHREGVTKSVKHPSAIVGEKFLQSMQKKVTTRPCDFNTAEQIEKDKDWEQKSGFAKIPVTSGFPPLEHAAIRYLRRYSNYLAPRLGLSGDMLALVSLFLRNLVLLQLALLSFLAIFVFLAHVILEASNAIVGSATTPIFDLLNPDWILSIGIGLLVLVLVLSGAQLHYFQTKKGRRNRQLRRLIPFLNGVLAAIALVASWVVVVSGTVTSGIADLKYYILLAVVIYFFVWSLVFGFLRHRKDRKSARRDKVRWVLVPLVAGTVFGLMGYASAQVLQSAWAKNDEHLAALVTLGPAAMLLVISFIVTVNIGTARDLFSEMHREWWARFGGFILYAGALWSGLVAIALYSPAFVSLMGDGGIAAIIAWATSSGAGAWIARNASPSSDEDKDKGAAVKAILTRVAPWLFIIGLAIIVAVGVNGILEALPRVEPWNQLIKSHWNPIVGMALSVLLFLVITWGLDINIFSAHTMYKNRLVRAYLGASRAGLRSDADPFTAFDKEDDVPLAKLREQRPYSLLNATINMTGGDDLAWQTRRAASFTFTPKFVGYEAKSSSGADLGAFRCTHNYASGYPANTGRNEYGLSLGTAMAVSGAAASPNMGYHTSTGIATLLTIFNMRLGYWGGNPAKSPKWRSGGDWDVWRKKGPSIAARPIYQELIGAADAESPWVNLTDGGHFENLGLYELVRRRCRFIVVTDAGCDPKHEFQDLANAIRMCWTDLGVHIYLPALDLVGFSEEDARTVKSHGCFGLIEYSDRERDDDQRYGVLLYIKASLTENELSEFVDIREYAKANKAFPHQTTGDQFFDENQFEAYRHLGYCVADSMRNEIDRLFVGQTSRINKDRLKDIWEPLVDYQNRYKRKRQGFAEATAEP